MTTPQLLARLDPAIDTDPVYIIYTPAPRAFRRASSFRIAASLTTLTGRESYQIAQDEVIGNQAPFFFDNSTLGYLSVPVLRSHAGADSGGYLRLSGQADRSLCEQAGSPRFSGCRP